MHNPSVVNPVNLLTSTGAGVKPAANAGVTPAVPFQQVLTKEVGQRQQSQPNTEKTPASRTENAAPPARQQTARAPESKTEAKTAKNEAKPAAKQSEPAKEDEPVEENQDVAAGSELLALVANLGQAAVKPEDEAKTGKDDARDAGEDQQLLMPAAGAMTMPLDAAAKKTVPSDGAQGITAVEGGAERAGAQLTAADGALASSITADVAGQAQAGKKGGAETDLAGKFSTDDTAARAALQQKPDARFSINGADLKAQENAQALAATISRDGTRQSFDAALAPVQQAALSISQASGASEKLTPALGTPAWDQALGQKIVWMVAGGEQSASLTLNPPDLGPLQVVLNVSNDQANATFIAAQPEVRDALEAALPKLRDMMSEAGIQLGQANVSAQAQGQQQPGEQQRQGQPHFGQALSGQADTAGAPTTPRAPARSGTLGMVDTFA